MCATDVANDTVFNDVVDAMENKGHNPVRVAFSLREWLLWGDADPVEDDEEEEDGEPVTDPVEALSLGILALNTFASPDATSPEDFAYMDARLSGAAALLCEIREWVIAQGDDFINIGLGRGE